MAPAAWCKKRRARDKADGSGHGSRQLCWRRCQRRPGCADKPPGGPPQKAEIDTSTNTYLYNANGQLLHQRNQDINGNTAYHLYYHNYDKAGNVLQYSPQ